MAQVTQFPFEAENVDIELVSRRGQRRQFGPANLKAYADEYWGIMQVVVQHEGAPNGEVIAVSLDRWALYATKRSSGGGGCILTTACVTVMGLPDSCHELEAFRAMRDEYIRAQPSGLRVIDGYYATAPRVIAAIDAQPDAEIRWRAVYETLVAPVTELVDRGDLAGAADHALRVYSGIKKANGVTDS